MIFRAIALLLLLAINASATIGTVQVVTATGGGSNASQVTFTPSAVTTGSYVAITFVTSANSALKTVPGANEKDWIPVHVNWGVNSAGTTSVYLYVYKVITGGQTSVVTSTTSGATGPCSGVLREYSVCAGCSLVPDVWRSGNTGNTTTPTTSTTDTTLVGNELIIATLGARAQTSSSTNIFSSPTNSFSVAGGASSTFNTANGDRACGILERIVNVTGTWSTGATMTSNQWVAAISTFREVPQRSSRMSSD